MVFTRRKRPDATPLNIPKQLSWWLSSPFLPIALIVAIGLATTATTTTEAFQLLPRSSHKCTILPHQSTFGHTSTLFDSNHYNYNYHYNHHRGRRTTNAFLLRDPRVEDSRTHRVEDTSRRVALESVNSSSSSSKNKEDLSGFSSELTTSQQQQQDLATGLEKATKEEQAVYKAAIIRTLGWVGAASLFGIGLLVAFGPETSEEFFAGYLVEQSLSVDNLFVFLLLFEYFKVPLGCQDRVLSWGILGAIVMRAIMIGLGAAALQNFHEILLVFAAVLVYSSAKVLLSVDGDDDEEEDPSENAIVKFSQSIMSSTPHFDGDRFFTIVDGVRKATPLFICMIAVEISDVVFAVDSIPAVFGVTENPLVVFTSNMFAIMGLRSLYTILSKAAADLKYLEPAVAVVLGFIGSKMIAEYFGYGIPTEVALIVVAGMLGTGVGLSVWERKSDAAAAAAAAAEDERS